MGLLKSFKNCNYRHAIPKHYQFKEDKYRERVQKDESQIRTLFYECIRHKPNIKIFHHMVADFWVWAMGYNNEGNWVELNIDGISLPNYTTPFMQQIVEDRTIIPIYTTLYEHNIQYTIGIVPFRYLREYKVNKEKGFVEKI